MILALMDLLRHLVWRQTHPMRTAGVQRRGRKVKHHESIAKGGGDEGADGPDHAPPPRDRGDPTSPPLLPA
jgi:hypothetical protein